MSDHLDEGVKSPEEVADWIAARLGEVAEVLPGVNRAWREIPVGQSDQMGTWLRNRLAELGGDMRHRRAMAAAVAVTIEVIAQNGEGHLFLPMPALAGLVVLLDHLTGRAGQVGGFGGE